MILKRKRYLVLNDLSHNNHGSGSAITGTIFVNKIVEINIGNWSSVR